ncbi:uncharacterized protein [Temnothorax longispinosus]|uniref:uncharacterized protein n=1 Tax=Temnothorax longispinosus TaxID=300112 RepID=UPI003A99E286
MSKENAKEIAGAVSKETNREIEGFIRSQHELYGRIAHSYENLRKALESNWAKFEAQHEKIYAAYWEILVDHDYEKKDVPSTAEEAYIQQKACSSRRSTSSRYHTDQRMKAHEKLDQLLQMYQQHQMQLQQLTQQVQTLAKNQGQQGQQDQQDQQDLSEDEAVAVEVEDGRVPLEHIYINRKGYYSINTQLICDWRLRIMHINARYAGSTHDTFIWNNSNAKTAMVHLYRRFPQKNFHLLGDSGYSLRPWMMTPIIGAVEGSPEALYNRKQMRCRALVEQCNGLLKMRFRCLLKHRVLYYSPPTASKIIYTCAVLHNMCIDQNVPLDLNDDNEDIGDFGMYNENHIANERNMVERNVRRIDADLAAGRSKQRLMIVNYFS